MLDITKMTPERKLAVYMNAARVLLEYPKNAGNICVSVDLSRYVRAGIIESDLLCAQSHIDNYLKTGKSKYVYLILDAAKLSHYHVRNFL